MPVRPLFEADLAAILDQVSDAFESLRGARIFLTGGTGFFGIWLLEALLHANRRSALGLNVTVLTRDVDRFITSAPHLALDPAITPLHGDVRDFAFPGDSHSHIIHAAADSSTRLNDAPNDLAESIVQGMGRVLRLAAHTGAQRLLFVSTGAVYGRSTDVLNTPEIYLDDHTPRRTPQSYEAAKRTAELLVFSADYPQLEVVVARCFAFVGPHLPLDRHFAIGNFISAAIAGRPIVVTGDGTPRRSWMYMTDLTVWLLTLLTRGEARTAYNVGSPHGYTIAEAATLTSRVLQPSLPIKIAQAASPDAPIDSYVPSVIRASELGLTITVPLDDALRRTAAWHGFIPHHATGR